MEVGGFFNYEKSCRFNGTYNLFAKILAYSSESSAMNSHIASRSFTAESAHLNLAICPLSP